MREMNFFRPYLKEKPKSSPVRLLVILLILALIGGLSFATVDLYMRQNAIQQELADLDEQLLDPDRVAAVKRVDDKTEKLAIIDGLEEALHSNQVEFDKINVVSDDFMNLLNAQVPDGAMIKTLSINGEAVSISGSAINHHAVSQFAYNLRQTGRFNLLNIQNIQNQDANYDFMISLSLFVGEKKDESQ